MASKRLVLIMYLMVGRTCGREEEKCAASIQGVGDMPGVCPSTWIQWGGNCYKVTGHALDWHAAGERCVQMGGTMVVPQSEGEINFLLGFIPQLPKDKFWINCNEIQIPGQWHCKEWDTEVTFTEMPWYPAEPNSLTENCATFCNWNVPGTWHDISCERQFHTVCKQHLPVVSPKLHL